MSLLDDKHPLLQHAVRQMHAVFGDDAFALIDHWEESIAIGVARRDDSGTLVYVAVYDGETPFHVELELPPQGGNDLPFTSAGTRSDLSLAEVLDLVANHLGLARVERQ